MIHIFLTMSVQDAWEIAEKNAVLRVLIGSEDETHFAAALCCYALSAVGRKANLNVIQKSLSEV